MVQHLIGHTLGNVSVVEKARWFPRITCVKCRSHVPETDRGLKDEVENKIGGYKKSLHMYVQIVLHFLFLLASSLSLNIV